MTDTAADIKTPRLARRGILLGSSSLLAAASLLPSAHAQATAPAGGVQGKPNIITIMGDDVGWFNIGAYHRGMMAGRIPNLDRLATEGMLFTIITRRRAARRDAPTSSPARSRSVLA
jgi:arylsulfatase